MSFFGRVLVTAAVVAGVVHVFRRDLRRIVGVLQKPAAAFLTDVRRELDAAAPPDDAAKAAAADAAAASLKAGAAPAAAPAAPAAAPPPPPPMQ